MAMDPMEMAMDPLEMAMVPLAMEMDQMVMVMDPTEMDLMEMDLMEMDQMVMDQMETEMDLTITEMDPMDCVARSHVRSVNQSGSQYARITHLPAAKKSQPKLPPQCQLRSASRSPPKCAEM